MAKREIEVMRIYPGEKGGHVVEHEYRRPVHDKHPMSYEPPEKHIFGPGDDRKLTAHISKTLGLSDAKEEEEEAKPGKKSMAERVKARMSKGPQSDDL